MYRGTASMATLQDHDSVALEEPHFLHLLLLLHMRCMSGESEEGSRERGGGERRRTMVGG